MRGTEVRRSPGVLFSCTLADGLPLHFFFEQGSWWLSYRPVLKVELVTPTGSPYGRLVRRVPVPAIEMPDEPLVPPYSE